MIFFFNKRFLQIRDLFSLVLVREIGGTLNLYLSGILNLRDVLQLKLLLNQQFLDILLQAGSVLSLVNAGPETVGGHRVVTPKFVFLDLRQRIN